MTYYEFCMRVEKKIYDGVDLDVNIKDIFDDASNEDIIELYNDCPGLEYMYYGDVVNEYYKRGLTEV